VSKERFSRSFPPPHPRPHPRPFKAFKSYVACDNWIDQVYLGLDRDKSWSLRSKQELSTMDKVGLAWHVWNVILSYPTRIYQVRNDTAVKNVCKHKPTKNSLLFSFWCLIYLGLFVEFVFSAMLRSLVKTRLCVRWNFSHFNSVAPLSHSAGFTTADFPSDSKTIEWQLDKWTRNKHSTSLHSLPEHTFVKLSFSIF